MLGRFPRYWPNRFNLGLYYPLYKYPDPGHYFKLHLFFSFYVWRFRPHLYWISCFMSRFIIIYKTEWCYSHNVLTTRWCSGYSTACCAIVEFDSRWLQTFVLAMYMFVVVCAFMFVYCACFQTPARGGNPNEGHYVWSNINIYINSIIFMVNTRNNKIITYISIS